MQSGHDGSRNVGDGGYDGLGLKSCNFVDGDRAALYKVAAALLNIGNVQMESRQDDTVAVTEKTMPFLKEAETLLGVSGLSDLLIEKVVISPRSKSEYHIALDLASASGQRDALVKHIYTLMFNLIIARINLNIETDREFHKFIGLLDVFGFEVFQTNSFEQLCINYANERLHNFFLMRVFEVEIELYRMQNLQVPALNYPDNAKVIELLEKSPTGIFPLLDAQCKMPKGSDKGFCASAQKTHAGHPNFLTLATSSLKVKGTTDDNAFVISHFAGDVCYTCSNFLEKNSDHLSAQFETELKKSKQVIVEQMVSLHQGKLSLSTGSGGKETPRQLARKSSQPNASARNTTARSNQKGGQPSHQQQGSVGKKFLLSLKQLMREIATTHPYFIRCIKPNNSLQPVEFATSMVLGQLEKSGTIECVKLMQDGYPSRAPYEDLLHRFQNALPDFMLSLDAQEFVQLLLLACNCKEGDYQLGQDMVFFRSNKGGVLQELMMMRKDDVAQRIVTNARESGIAATDPKMADFLNKLEAFVELRKKKRQEALENYKSTVLAAIGLFKWVRWGEKRALLDEKAALKVQAIQRGKLARVHVEAKKRQAREAKAAQAAAIAAAKAAEDAMRLAVENAAAGVAAAAVEAARKAQEDAEARAKDAQDAADAVAAAEKAQTDADTAAAAAEAQLKEAKKLDLAAAGALAKEEEEEYVDEKWFKKANGREFHRFLMCKGVEWGFQYHNFYGDWELADAEPICHDRPHYVHNTMYGGYAHLFHTMDPHYNVPRWVIGPAPGNENGWAFCESDAETPFTANTTWISWDGFEWHSCKTFRFVPKEHELDGLSEEEDFIDDEDDFDAEYDYEGGADLEERTVKKMTASEYDHQLTERQNNSEIRQEAQSADTASTPANAAEEEDKKGDKKKKKKGGGIFKSMGKK